MTTIGGGAGLGGFLSKHPAVTIAGGTSSILGLISSEYSDWRESSNLTRIISRVVSTAWTLEDAFSFEKRRELWHSGRCAEYLTEGTPFIDTYSKNSSLGSKPIIFRIDPFVRWPKQNNDPTLPPPN